VIYNYGRTGGFMVSSSEDLKFLLAEQNAIDKSKFIESQKLHRDLFFDETGKPSQNFYIWWIENHAENFRKAWFSSKCRICKKVCMCNDCLKNECQTFEYELNLIEKEENNGTK
jgi:hypothetical protein